MRRMNVTLFGIRNCDTVRKARAWLDAQGVAYAFHDFKVLGVDAARLGIWCEKFGWETVLNRAGTTFRSLTEADRAGLDRDRAIALMLAQPSMIKRPVVESSDGLLIGFQPDRWAAVLARNAA